MDEKNVPSSKLASGAIVGQGRCEAILSLAQLSRSIDSEDWVGLHQTPRLRKSNLGLVRVAELLQHGNS